MLLLLSRCCSLTLCVTAFLEAPPSLSPVGWDVPSDQNSPPLLQSSFPRRPPPLSPWRTSESHKAQSGPPVPIGFCAWLSGRVFGCPPASDRRRAESSWSRSSISNLTVFAWTASHGFLSLSQPPAASSAASVYSTLCNLGDGAGFSISMVH